MVHWAMSDYEHETGEFPELDAEICNICIDHDQYMDSFPSRMHFSWYSPNKDKYVLTRRYFGEEPIYLYSDIPFEE
jgi:hypothetical protein